MKSSRVIDEKVYFVNYNKHTNRQKPITELSRTSSGPSDCVNINGPKQRKRHSFLRISRCKKKSIDWCIAYHREKKNAHDSRVTCLENISHLPATFIVDIYGLQLEWWYLYGEYVVILKMYSIHKFILDFSFFRKFFVGIVVGFMRSPRFKMFSCSAKTWQVTTTEVSNDRTS